MPLKFHCNMKAVTQTFHDYGKRSSLHGLSHMYQSSDMWRKIFWLILTIIGAFFCFFHIYKTVENYLDTPITSIWLTNSDKGTFPHVSLCNLKPASESLLSVYKEKVYEHMEKSWYFFDKWFPEERRRQTNESRVNYKHRLKALFRKYMEIFWVSDDTRDIGMLDDAIILFCSYNGKACSSKNFKLIQNYKYWNCYDFIPPYREILNSGHDSGLELILYTDSDLESTYSNVVYKRHKSKTQEEQRPYTLREYIKGGKDGGTTRTLNQVLAGNSFESNGLRVIVHAPDDYPTLSGIEFDLPNGVFSTIEFSQTNRINMNRPPSFPCRMEPPEVINYVTYFGSQSKGCFTRKYTLTDREAVVEMKQKDIYDVCSCYTHKLPFQYNTSMLCYFAAGDNTKNPDKDTLHRIKCHDEEFKRTEAKTFEYMQRAHAFSTCQSTQYTASKVQTFWPRADDIIEFVNSIIVPQFKNGTEFTATDRHPHHLLNDIYKLPNFRTRENIILNTLVNQGCESGGGNSSEKISNFWCTELTQILNNVLRIWVKPDSPAASMYKEQENYEWPEMLSEIGGIFGLWLGMSLLTGFEFLELFGQIFTATESSSSSNDRQPTFDMESMPQEIQMLLMKALRDDAQENNCSKSELADT